ncbi:MAG: glycine--tRNA ligase subunit beta [Rhodospirillaceae bacterium]
MPELLLELLSEEIPARMQARAADDLKRLVTNGLKAAGLEFTEARAYVTPRRLALTIDGIPEKQPDVSEERRGPPTDAPAKAQEGFRKGLRKDTVVEERETDKGTFFFAKIEKAGEKTRLLLPDIIGDALNGFVWPKSMRWGRGKTRWVRPLHSILAIYDQEGVNFEFAGVKAGIRTWGHPFMSDADIDVSDFADYEKSLKAAKVVISRNDRMALIAEQAAELCKKESVMLKEDQGLLDDVAGLVEWPVVLMGTIDKAFMGLPPEVLTTSMRAHQKYFSTTDKVGRLAPKFVVVANRETADGGRQVIAGNERVLRARLADAKFFWDQDRNEKLESRVDALKDRVFHAKLGTLFEKAERMQALAAELANACGADAANCKEAAQLAKADLSTGMVGEFPELQGLMGGYYARHDGKDDAVADAIAEHYAPQGPGDACPKAPVSVAVALADKIDTLVGFWAIDEKPTGSKDPYALRRAALGVIRLIIENSLRLNLMGAFSQAYSLFEDPIDKGSIRYSIGKEEKASAGSFQIKEIAALSTITEVASDLMAFFADRLKVHLREKGVQHDHIDAIFALGGEDDLVRLLARVDALTEFLGTEDGGNLLTAYRRAANILKIEEKKDSASYAAAPDEALLAEADEKALFNVLNKAGPNIDGLIGQEKFTDAMAALAGLRAPVDAFFDNVTVNADDPKLRENRLKLLSMIRGALESVADFSKIEG